MFGRDNPYAKLVGTHEFRANLMAIELRPLSAGEVLDRTFQVFRSHFTMFLGMATIAAGIQTAGSALYVTGTRYALRHGYGHALAAIWTSSGSLINLCVSLLAFSVVFAAMARAVFSLYLGQTTGISQAYREIWPHWFRYVRLSVTAGFLALWPALLVVGGFIVEIALAPKIKSATTATTAATMFGFTALEMLVAAPICIWLLCRLALCSAACVIEDLKVRASLKRSVMLSKGLRWRIFLLLLLVYVVQVIVVMVLMTPTFVFLVRAHGQLSMGLTIYQLIIGFITTTLITPVYGIGLTVIYLDARIRKEGYDIEVLMQRSGGDARPADTPELPGESAPITA